MMGKRRPGREGLKLPNPPSAIDLPESGTRFVIFDAPNPENLQDYAECLRNLDVRVVVRVCNSTYSMEQLQAAGFETHDLPFSDGSPPPRTIIAAWLSIVNRMASAQPPGGAIGIHCIAGLGRAPVLVAVAAIESGISPTEAVQLIRQRRRGAINRSQLHFLLHYKPISRGVSCVIV